MPGARRHRDAVERAEAHRRVDRPAVEDGRDRAAAAEVADDEARAREPLAPPTAPRGRGSRSAGCPTRAAQRRGTAYAAASSGIVAWKVVSKTATCADVAAARAAPPRSQRARRRCAAARARRACAARRAPSRRARPARREARAAVDDAVRDARARQRGASASEPTGVDVSSSSTSESFRLVEPALTTRIPDTRQPAQYGQAQSAIAGSSIPCSRV